MIAANKWKSRMNLYRSRNTKSHCAILYYKSQTYLKTGVDGEATSCWIHTCHILCVVNVLERQFYSVIPMTMINVLSDQCVGLYSEVFVNLISEKHLIRI